MFEYRQVVIMTWKCCKPEVVHKYKMDLLRITKYFLSSSLSIRFYSFQIYISAFADYNNSSKSLHKAQLWQILSDLVWFSAWTVTVWHESCTNLKLTKHIAPDLNQNFKWNKLWNLSFSVSHFLLFFLRSFIFFEISERFLFHCKSP